MSPTTTDCIPYNQSTRIVELELLIHDIVTVFSSECFLPPESEKHRVYERCKDSLRKHHNLDLISRLKIQDLIKELRSNPPGITGIEFDDGIRGNKYIDAGYDYALSLLSSKLGL